MSASIRGFLIFESSDDLLRKLTFVRSLFQHFLVIKLEYLLDFIVKLFVSVGLQRRKHLIFLSLPSRPPAHLRATISLPFHHHPYLDQSIFQLLS